MADAHSDAAFERRKRAAQPRRATAADREQVIECLTAAFATDPVMSWIGRKDAKRDQGRRAMFRFLVGKLGLPGGELWTADDYGAAALWIPPERADMKLPWWEEVRLLPTIMTFTGIGGLSRADAFRKAADKHHPKDKPHFYLMTVGVNPKFQGQGLGSALLEANLAAIDAKGLPSYLESSNEKNVPLYRRHGYQVINEFRPAPDGPPLWGMWREAKAR
ncbi:MAG: GNAT family N-acetyltransferase [Alphaproteobacteria bacterium]|nr:GNAT family N-acetyltransferase [Alphaproteobacteria bacterium]